MTDRRSSRSPIAKVTEAEIVGDASFRLPDGVVVNYSFSKIEQVTVDHMSISPEVMMVGIHQAEAEKQVAIARYAVPAKEQTVQVKAVGVAVCLTVLMGVVGACFRPEAAREIASMVAVVGVVFGGIFAAMKYWDKSSSNERT